MNPRQQELWGIWQDIFLREMEQWDIPDVDPDNESGFPAGSEEMILAMTVKAVSQNVRFFIQQHIAQEEED